MPVFPENVNCCKVQEYFAFVHGDLGPDDAPPD